MDRSPTPGGTWVRQFHRSPDSAVQLVCLPYAGGSASYFHQLSGLLSPGLQTLAIQYPGRQDRRSEPPIESIPELADRIFDVVRELADRPLALFGHSMGSILAFEVGRRLQRQGTVPVWLFASGYPAPSRIRGGDVHRRDDAGVVAELRSLDEGDARWLDDKELLAAFLPPVRSDYKAIETHIRDHESSLECPITTLVGDNDPYTTMDEAAAWQQHTSGKFDFRIFPGGHFYLGLHWRGVADTILAAVGEALG